MLAWVLLLPAMAMAGPGEGAKLIDGGIIRAVQLSYDNRTVFTGSEDGWIRYFDLAESKMVNEMFHGKEVSAMTLLVAGTALVVGGKSGKVGIHKLQDQKRAAEMLATGPVQAVAVSPDRQWLFASSEKFLQVFDLFSKPCCSTEHVWTTPSPVTALAVTPDMRILAGSEDGTVRALNNRTGESVGEAERKHGGRVDRVVAGPGGATFSAGAGRVLVHTPELKFQSEFVSSYRDPDMAAFAVDLSGRIFVGTGTKLTVWEPTSPDPVAQLETGGKVYSLALLQNRTTVVVGGGDGKLQAVDWQDPAAPLRLLRHGFQLLEAEPMEPEGAPGPNPAGHGAEL